MNDKSNKYIAVAYKLYITEDGKQELVEEATAEKPFQFISGFGIALDSFESIITGLDKGHDFDFTLTKDQAYGDFMDERVVELDRSIFTINGHFDHENIFVDAVVPLQNEDGNRFYGRVMKITDSKVVMDLNHPLAGKDLNFKGSVIESREATNEEIQGLINRLSGESCGCGCGCHGDCDGDGCGSHEHGHECGCGSHEHEHECGCGHCH